jgi:hypothetical protein
MGATQIVDDYAVSVGRIKGAVFRELVLRYGGRSDPAGPASAISASRWYAAGVVHGLLDAILAGMSAEERSALARESAALAMAPTLRGPLVRLAGTPERWAQHGQRIWRAYYETGVVTTTQRAPTCWEQTIAAWAEHHPFLCEQHAAATALLHRAMGHEAARVERTACVSLGAPACSYRIDA